ncbi:MAG TPA: DUF5676 family membrane protein [Burkholderiales bacterium]|nr:DUF5676 family membrane protein [Burkholderiales bacterium]
MKSSKALAVGIASAVTFGALSLACLVAVSLSPDGMVTFFNNWMHGIDLTSIKRPAGKPIGFGEAVSGFVSVVVVSFAFGALFGWVYERVGGKR